MSINYDKYCVGCSSEQGFMQDRQEWCAVCWDRRRPIPRDIRRELDELKAAVRRARK